MRETIPGRPMVVLFLLVAVLIGCSGGGSESGPLPKTAMGPLKVHPSNPRYFTDGTGRAVYLTGSHLHTAFKDRGLSDPPQAFDYPAYLEFLVRHHHNFIRLWTWELTQDREGSMTIYWTPFPWQRPGPALALDGKPKFDLMVFDQAYFDRLRERVIAARDRGIYVGVMLFEGWALRNRDVPWGWNGHPFNIANNITGINGDRNGDGSGIEAHTLADPEITALQERYVRKVLDTLSDLDNVIYEISNEDDISSAAWQYHMVEVIRNHEHAKGLQHPVGVTTTNELGNAFVYHSSAEWVSPAVSVWGDPSDPLRVDPPAADGSKVVLLDTDHLWGMGGDRIWVWKAFLRGYNPIYMDTDTLETGNEQRDGARIAMGQTLRFAEKSDLASMMPRNELSSTRYCLASPGVQYLVYQPDSGPFEVQLAPGKYRYEWFDPRSGASVFGEMAVSGSTTFTPPFGGDAVLFLTAAALK